MAKLKASCDRKVWAYKGQKNTFGLLPGPKGTCPGATLGIGGCCDGSKSKSGREDCYVFRIMSIYKNVEKVLAHNTKLLTEADLDGKIELLDEEFTRFTKSFQRKKFPQGNKYRLHWAGDIFNEEYARALVAAIMRHPEIDFWTYTRTFDVVGIFKGVSNLQLYLSLDQCNLKSGLETYNKYKDERLHLSYMGDKRPDIGHDLIACPTDEGVMKVEGACLKCKMCLKGKDIWFKTKR